MKESAQDESAADFDPSGTSGYHDEENSEGSSERALSLPIGSAQPSTESASTDLTGVSTAFTGLNLQGTLANRHAQSDNVDDWDSLSLDRKTTVLGEMFPSIKGFDISYVLIKSDEDYGRAVEELLTRVFLEVDVDEKGERTFKKGIDGFVESSDRSRRKRKGTGRIQRRTSSTPAPLDDKSANGTWSPLSRWDRAKEDIDFITSRTQIQRAAISSLYHKQGASVSATLAALCSSIDNEQSHVPDAPASVIQLQATDLATNFPRLDLVQSMGLVTMTYPSTAAAQELAHALISGSDGVLNGKIVPSYRPRTPSPTTSSIRPSSTTIGFSSHTTECLLANRAQAYSQANSAYRTSRSKPLMSGAAAYYSSVARDASAAVRRREATEAEALVERQSPAGQIDLHGISVHDAVRIARNRVEQWWTAEGREWAREGKARDGRLVIVTGKGQHSQGGRGRLGPAVGAMLVREGWKVEFGNGVVDIVGRARR